MATVHNKLDCTQLLIRGCRETPRMYGSLADEGAVFQSWLVRRLRTGNFWRIYKWQPSYTQPIPIKRKRHLRQLHHQNRQRANQRLPTQLITQRAGDTIQPAVDTTILATATIHLGVDTTIPAAVPPLGVAITDRSFELTELFDTHTKVNLMPANDFSCRYLYGAHR